MRFLVGFFTWTVVSFTKIPFKPTGCGYAVSELSALSFNLDSHNQSLLPTFNRHKCDYNVAVPCDIQDISIQAIPGNLSRFKNVDGGSGDLFGEVFINGEQITCTNVTCNKHTIPIRMGNWNDTQTITIKVSVFYLDRIGGPNYDSYYRVSLVQTGQSMNMCQSPQSRLLTIDLSAESDHRQICQDKNCGMTLQPNSCEYQVGVPIVSGVHLTVTPTIVTPVSPDSMVDIYWTNHNVTTSKAIPSGSSAVVKMDDDQRLMSITVELTVKNRNSSKCILSRYTVVVQKSNSPYKPLLSQLNLTSGNEQLEVYPPLNFSMAPPEGLVYEAVLPILQSDGKLSILVVSARPLVSEICFVQPTMKIDWPDYQPYSVDLTQVMSMTTAARATSQGPMFDPFALFCCVFKGNDNLAARIEIWVLNDYCQACAPVTYKINIRWLFPPDPLVLF
jgi:hypothetical protein